MKRQEENRWREEGPIVSVRAPVCSVFTQEPGVQRLQPLLQLERVGIQVWLVIDLCLVGHCVKATDNDPDVVEAEIEARPFFRTSSFFSASSTCIIPYSSWKYTEQ